MRKQLFTGLLLLGPLDATAQNDNDPIPIRRVQIIEDEREAPAPPRAIPVRQAEPAPQIDPTPEEPELVQPAADGSTAKSNPHDDLFNYANLVYSYKYNDLAVQQYTKYLRSFPKRPEAEVAWYRLGESYLNLAKMEEAKRCFLRQITEFPNDKYTAAGAHRLASIAFRVKDYDDAKTYFAIAAKHSTEAKIQLSSLYFKGRCEQLSGDLEACFKSYTELSKVEKDNPYRYSAMLLMARLDSDEGKNKEALKRFEEIAESEAPQEIRTESMAKAGIISADLGEIEKSNKYYEKILGERGKVADAWKPISQFGLVRNSYAEGNYREVINAWQKGNYELGKDARSKLLLMVGNAYRKEDELGSAIKVYSELEKRYPGLSEGREAGYRKLLCYYDTGDDELPKFVDYYVSRQRKADKNHAFIDRALLLKGETLFHQENYKEAAKAYAQIRVDNIPERLRAGMLYKRGWAQAESDNLPSAVASFSTFLKDYPDHKLTSQVTAKRAECYRKQSKLTLALNDFQRIVTDHPSAIEVEMALQQSALIYGESRDLRKMIASYNELLRQFPDSKAKAEAYYWIGWGHFELKNFSDAINPLDQARKEDEDAYFDRATLRIILSYYYLQQLDALTKEIDYFREKRPEFRVPPKVLGWAGSKLFTEDRVAEAETYLEMASTPESPQLTDPHIWKFLGKTKLSLNEFKASEQALDYYLETLSDNSKTERAKILLEKSRALMGQRQFKLALKNAELALALKKEGRVNALSWLALGDIEMAREDFQEAAKKYIIPSQLFDDPNITPMALAKAATALEKSGQKSQATEAREELLKRFPGYKLPKDTMVLVAKEDAEPEIDPDKPMEPVVAEGTEPGADGEGMIPIDPNGELPTRRALPVEPEEPDVIPTPDPKEDGDLLPAESPMENQPTTPVAPQGPVPPTEATEPVRPAPVPVPAEPVPAEPVPAEPVPVEAEPAGLEFVPQEPIRKALPMTEETEMEDVVPEMPRDAMPEERPPAPIRKAEPVRP